jgi:N-acetylmuramoyl-L-alanine amidase
MVRAALGILVLLGTAFAAPSGLAAPPRPVETMYSDAVAKENAVHAALADPQALRTVLKAVRTVVGDYEAIVRAYPTSGYSDDALWRAGLVSIDAFRKFGDPRDHDAALRLLHMLETEYPASKLAKNAPSVLKSLVAAPSAPAASPAAPTVSTPASAKVVQRSATITAIHRTVLPNAIRVTIDLDAEVAFHDERIDGPPRIFVDFSPATTVAALQDKTIRFDGDPDPVHQLRFGRHDDTIRVVLDAVGVRSYSVYPLYNPYRLVIDCVRDAPTPPRAVVPPQRTSAAATMPAAPAPRAAARVAPPPLRGRQLVADFVFPLAGAAAINSDALRQAFESDAPDTGAAQAAPAAAPATVAATPDPNLAGGFSIARQLGLGVSRIVIDPGHGGHDPGAQKNGVSEAELVLDVALRLEKLLQKQPGLEVILTRRTDEFVALQERTAIANREGADLFLSIHANASEYDSARGVETYYLNFASNLSSAAVAARENAASGQAMGALPDLVKSIALNNKLDESRDFANEVQHAMIDKLRPSNKTIRDLGVKQAPFVVLIGAAMPSVLAEISFVTNGQEAKLLKSSAYRDRIAEALYTAIRKYQNSLKSVRTVSLEP